MKIGLFGGTFNPIHLGHIKAVFNIYKQFSLDCVYFIPLSIPPHKNLEGVVDSQARFDMIKSAILDYENFFVSDVEIKRKGLSYTIDTIEFFKAKFIENNRFFFLLGLDAFLEIDTWKLWHKIFKRCSLIIMQRNCEFLTKEDGQHKIVKNYIKNCLARENNIFGKYSYQKDRKCFIHDEMQTIYLSGIKKIDISSTEIREKISSNEDISKMVPLQVERYIKIKGLYR